jgi:hypothetical protein
MYLSKQFEADLKFKSYINDPTKVNRDLLVLLPKFRSIVQKYNYTLGSPYTEKSGKNYYYLFPIYYKGIDEDSFYNKVEKKISSDFIDITNKVDGLDEKWKYSGIREKKSGLGSFDSCIEIIYSLV